MRPRTVTGLRRMSRVELGTGKNVQLAERAADVPTTSANWKSFVLTWAAVYPTLLAIASLLAWIAPGLPLAAQLAITSLTLTGLLTWVILPRLNSRARPWLYRGAQPTPDRPRSSQPDHR